MRTILHLSADFPDSIVPAKTKAIVNLVDETAGYRHIVYSLNRTNKLSGISARPFQKDRFAVSYPAPAKGIFLDHFLKQLADWILRDLERQKIFPDLIHAHKFTIEGLAASRIAKTLGLPMFVSIQGHTDLKVFNFKRGLHPVYSEIWHEALHVFPFSAWSWTYFESALGRRSEGTSLLPCITAQDNLMRSSAQGPRIISVFHLDNWRHKNAARMIQSVAALSKEIPEVRYDIYGSGKSKSVRALEGIIKKSGCESFVKLRGALPHSEVQKTMNKYAVLALPSLGESYGMVAAEALLSGVPVLISEGRGIDGIFDEEQIGAVCDPKSVGDMTEKLLLILQNETQLKQGIAIQQKRGDFDILRKESIVNTYSHALANAFGEADSMPSASSIAMSSLGE